MSTTAFVICGALGAEVQGGAAGSGFARPGGRRGDIPPEIA
jgi:hypothetical protein